MRRGLTMARTGMIARACGAAVMGVLICLVAAGCRTGPLETDHARAMAEHAYPGEAARGRDLDVLVRREGGKVQVVNREARRIEGMQLWLNEQWVDEIDEPIEPGEGKWMRLRGFINRYQEPFPTARLLRPEQAARVLSAELYDPETQMRYPLVATFEQGRGLRIFDW